MYYSLFILIQLFCFFKRSLGMGNGDHYCHYSTCCQELLRSGCKCTCVRRRRYRNPSDVENPTSDSQTLPPAQRHSGSFETIAIHLHTPPSQATTPPSSSPSTPDTIVRALQFLPAAEFNTLVDTPSSVALLITHEPVSANTKAKVKDKRKLL